MSNFMKSITHEFKFEDNKVRVQMNRLTRGQMLTISPHAPKSNGVDSDGEPVLEDQTVDEVYAMIEAGVNCLKENVLSFGGLTDNEGLQLEFDSICDEQYFTGLMNDMITVLINESMVTEKKPVKQKKARIK